ncbi:MAG: sulfotransferase domain-containing protein [Cytophagales bacterium]|nr:sulfotransferase domain-containing protein [Cytophagales bacterium]
MNKKQIKSLLKNNFLYNQIYHKIKINQEFKTEIQLLKNKHHYPSSVPSIIHFSLNKSATTFVKDLLFEIGSSKGMIPVRLHDYAFKTKLPYFDSLSFDEMEKYKHIFKSHGYVYSVFGGMVENIEMLSKLKVIFMVRDPRDILVSEYFSVAHSHPVPSKNGNKVDDFISKRNFAKEVDIDTYVLNQSQKIRSIYDRYLHLLIRKGHNIHLTKYEDMVEDFGSWLTNLLNYLELEVSSAFRKSIENKFDRAKPKAEDKKSHNRKGKRGDYLEKLNASTIDKLNAEFAEVIREFKFDDAA